MIKIYSIFYIIFCNSKYNEPVFELEIRYLYIKFTHVNFCCMGFLESKTLDIVIYLKIYHI